MRLRSLLFVPGGRQKMLDKARTFAPDALILDLEDAVLPEEKDQARDLVREAVQSGGYQAPVIVRINALSTGRAEADLCAVALPGLFGVCLPKAERPEDIQYLEAYLARLEREQDLSPGSLAIFPLLETALGVVQAYPVAAASRRVQGLCFGAEDFCRDVGALRTKEGREIAHARGHVLLGARATGAAAIDTVYTDIADQDGLLRETSFIRQLGFQGKLLIHPAQVAVVHQAFAPTSEEVSYARRVVRAHEEAAARGEGAFTLDGKMIDTPIVARAREVLCLASFPGLEDS